MRLIKDTENLNLVVDLQLYPHRAVVGSHDILEDEGRLNAIPQTLADEEVVDPPAHVALACACLYIPKGIVAALRVEERKVSTNPCSTSRSIQALSTGRNPEIFSLGLGPGQIDLLVSGIDVPADHNVPARFHKLIHVVQEVIVELQLVIQTLF